MPWPDRWPTATYDYLYGYLFKQAWAPETSTEGRLVPVNNTIAWDIKTYEGQMFYHNVVIREQFKFNNPLINKPIKGLDLPELTNDYDSMAEVIIIRDYLIKYVPDSKSNLQNNIISISRSITESLNEGIPKNKWRTVNKIRNATHK